LLSNLIVSHDRAICLVGGARISESAFSAAKLFADVFVAVDSGADFLLARDPMPLAVIGDLDSLSNAARHRFGDRLCHIPEQSTTDFEKALTRVAAPCVIALGFTGGRLDHLLAVLGAMVRHPGPPVILVDEDDASFVAQPGETVLCLGSGTRISVMPVSPCRAVTLSGVVWSFADQAMSPDSFTSPSNAALGGRVMLTTTDPVLVTLPRAQLADALKAVSRAG
jgi:thiamine pyrophosphokinase